MRLKWAAHLVAVALAFCAHGCGATYDASYLDYAQPWVDAGAQITLGVGDSFAVDVFREEELSMTFLVPEHGTVNYPMIGELYVLGRSCPELEFEIRDRLASGYIRNPFVVCQVEEVRSNRINIVGEVGAPGTYPYRTNMTIVDAVAQCGGLTSNAAQDRVIVTREIDGDVVEIEVPVNSIINGRAPNFPLWPNDTIFVPIYRIFQ